MNSSEEQKFIAQLAAQLLAGAVENIWRTCQDPDDAWRRSNMIQTAVDYATEIVRRTRGQ